jgi:hypothetical protein
MMQGTRTFGIAFMAMAALVPCRTLAAVSQADVIAAAFTPYTVAAPDADRVTVCHGFGCRLRTDVELSGSDRAQLARIMARGKASPAAELRAVAAAGAWFDRRVGGAAGTRGHVARAGASYMFDNDGQFDCIDSSRNMTTLLLLLDDLHLLRYHRPDIPVARGYVIDFRLPHATAVLTDDKTGQSWAVDSWTRAYGQPPEIMPLSRWEAGPY